MSLVPAAPTSNLDPAVYPRSKACCPASSSSSGESGYGEETRHEAGEDTSSVAYQQQPNCQMQQYENTAHFHEQQRGKWGGNQPYLNNKHSSSSSSSSAVNHHKDGDQHGTNAWVMYQDKSGHFYWHNHSTGESQWARESSPSATQYGNVESSHGVDFTRPSASSSSWRGEEESGALRKVDETAYVASDASEEGSVASSVGEGSQSASVDWDSEDEDDFEELLRTVEGQQALRDEEAAVGDKLEDAQQRRRDGYWGWLLPYHGMSRDDFDEASSDDDDGESDDGGLDDEEEGDEEEDEGEEDAEDLQQPSAPAPMPARRGRLRTKTLAVGPPPTLSSKAVRAIRGLVSATTWVVSTGLATLFVFARELVASRPAGMSEAAAEEAVQRWKQVVVLESRRRDQALEDGRAGEGEGLAAGGDEQQVGAQRRPEGELPGGRSRFFKKPPPLDLSVL